MTSSIRIEINNAFNDISKFHIELNRLHESELSHKIGTVAQRSIALIALAAIIASIPLAIRYSVKLILLAPVAWLALKITNYFYNKFCGCKNKNFLDPIYKNLKESNYSYFVPWQKLVESERNLLSKSSNSKSIQDLDKINIACATIMYVDKHLGIAELKEGNTSELEKEIETLATKISPVSPKLADSCLKLVKCIKSDPKWLYPAMHNSLPPKYRDETPRALQVLDSLMEQIS